MKLMLRVLKTISLKSSPYLGLEKADLCWENLVNSSVFVRMCSNAISFFSSQLPQTVKQKGGFLRSASFIIVLALALALPAPQFAADKEGLAFFLLLSLALNFIDILFGTNDRYNTTMVDMVVLAYFSVFVISTASSHYLFASLKGMAKIVVYVLSYFLFVLSLGKSQKRIVLVYLCLVIGGLLAALYGIYQYKIGVAPLATWEDPTIEVKGTRIFSTLGNPNLLAGYLIPLVPISFGLSMISLCARKIWYSFPLFLACGVIFVATILTGSRGGYIGLFISISTLIAISSTWLWWQRPKSRLLILALLVIMPVLMLFLVHLVPSLEQRVVSIFAGREHTSNSFRLNVWNASWHMFLDNWWIGVGPGNQAFRLAYGLYMKSGFDALGTYCVPLEVAVEAGIPGLLTFTSLIIILLLNGHRDFWHSESTSEKWLILCTVSAIMGILAHGIVDTVFYRPQVQFIFWLLVAALVVLHKGSKLSCSSNNQPKVGSEK